MVDVNNGICPHRNFALVKGFAEWDLNNSRTDNFWLFRLGVTQCMLSLKTKDQWSWSLCCATHFAAKASWVSNRWLCWRESWWEFPL